MFHMLSYGRTTAHTYFCLIAFLLIGLPSSSIAKLVSSSLYERARQENVCCPISIDVAVTDSNGNHIAQLQKKDFVVYVNDSLQETISVSKQDQPLTVCILFDVSASVSSGWGSRLPERLKKIRAALSRFIEAGHPSNRYFLIAITSRPHLLLDDVDASSALAQLPKLDLVRPWGFSALFDACSVAIEKIKGGAHKKGVIILVSEGQNTSSTTSRKSVERSLRENSVTMYWIKSTPVSSRAQYFPSESLLKDWVKASGGFAVHTNGYRKATDALSTIAQELQNRYEIIFIPTKAGEGGKGQKIEIKVRLAESSPAELRQTQLRIRQWYYTN